jgi:UDP-2,4-diacetamido-2,4,6-trideoxy-beta-L-altropyranose hydrolase
MICFRVDGANEIGMGHIFRCISLARELSSLGGIIFFVEKSKRVKDVIVSHGFPVVAPELFHDFAHNEKEEVIVITDLIEKKTTKEWCDAIEMEDNVIHVGIHDLGLNQFDSDVIIDGAITNIESYSKKDWIKYYLGKEYMIINTDFEKHIGMNKDYSKVLDKILLCFGGSDPSNITEGIVPRLSEHFKNIEFLVIAGPENESARKVKGKFRNVKILTGMKDISGIIFDSDILVTSGGILLYEAACIGTPTIAICHDKEQSKTALQFHKAEVAINMGLYRKLNLRDLISRIEELSRDLKKRQKMGEKGKELIDGKGIYRVKKIISDLKN